MRVVHLLRKCNPAEWGGTETAVQRLLEGLHQHQVDPVVFCPRLNNGHLRDPFVEAGWPVKRFNACVPVWGLREEQRRQLVAVGGNLMSFDLFGALRREEPVSLIHTHTQGRLAAIALEVARRRRLPFVITIHGGYMDLPESLRNNLGRSAVAGVEWGRLFGLLLRTRRFYADADAIVTCNENEAALFRARHPGKRVMVQPHSVPIALYQKKQAAVARAAFPEIEGKRILLSVGRIDAVKNQGWLVKQAPAIFQRHPQAMLVLAGACTDDSYGAALNKEIRKLGLQRSVLLTGGLPPGDPRLIGLFQEAHAVLLPSISETFGLVILESWAAGTVPISSHTSGASALIRDGHNGWLFGLDNPKSFHDAIDTALLRPELAEQLAAAGRERVATEFDTTVLAQRMKNLYERLIEEKHALRNSAG